MFQAYEYAAGFSSLYGNPYVTDAEAINGPSQLKLVRNMPVGYVAQPQGGCVSTGDPHFYTFDGNAYDFMMTGAFTTSAAAVVHVCERAFGSVSVTPIAASLCQATFTCCEASQATLRFKTASSRALGRPSTATQRLLSSGATRQSSLTRTTCMQTFAL